MTALPRPRLALPCLAWPRWRVKQVGRSLRLLHLASADRSTTGRAGRDPLAAPGRAETGIAPIKTLETVSRRMRDGAARPGPLAVEATDSLSQARPIGAGPCRAVPGRARLLARAGGPTPSSAAPAKRL